jgi:DNA polymerase-3 subunit delta
LLLVGVSLKFQTVQAFEKHLRESTPAHLAQVHMIIASCAYERKLLVEKVVHSLLQQCPQVHATTYDAASLSIEALLEECNTRELFSAQRILIVEEIDKLKKRPIEQLAHYLKSPAPFSKLILSGSSLKGLGDLYQSGKKEMVLLDLSEEKPWDRQKRLRQWVVNEASSCGKPLTAEAAMQLVEQIGPDMPALHRELEKLFCYVGERRQIELKDVQAISSVPHLQTHWQLAEALVWGEGVSTKDPSADVSWLLGLLSAVRAQLQNGLLIASLQDRGYQLQEVAHHLPQIRLSAIEKYFGVALRRKKDFFLQALKVQFEVELLAKNSSLSPGALFDLLHLKFLAHKQNVIKNTPVS